MKRLYQPRYAALAAATGLLTLNFWAWSLISPLAAEYAARLHLSPLDASILVAMPVLIGSLGRIPVGLLSDRYGGHRVLAAICLIACLPVAGLAIADNYLPLLSMAFGLGIAGASFAAGVPFVSSWFPRRKQGMALGVYAVGNAGTAIAGLLTPHLAANLGRQATFLAVALWLVVAGLLFYAWGNDAPAWKPAALPARLRLSAAAHWRATWQLAGLYVITFGAFVSFGLYLPLLLHTSYGLATADAAARAAGFVLLATAARPLGGWLSDRYGSRPVLSAAFFALAVLAAAVACTPSLMPVGTIAYLLLAATLGIGNGSVFARMGHGCDKRLIGTVTGLVGAAGGIGGFLPPILLGLSFQLLHSYAAALLLLAATCGAIFLAIHRTPMQPKATGGEAST